MPAATTRGERATTRGERATTRTETSRRPPKRKAARGGRPRRTDALRLGEHILEKATELFLSAGYGATSIEAVAARARVSKRTLYHRFKDKDALFAAVVHRIIQQIRPPPAVPLLQGGTLHEVLHRLALLVLHAALEPRTLALHRLVTGESARFPQLLRAVYAEGWSQEASTLIGDLLAREIPAVRWTPELRTFAAGQFLELLIAIPQRRAIGLGAPMGARELDAWAQIVVRFFVGGCRALATASAAAASTE
jgi:TetR/AcrR family transcriptional regulator, mexJK operon transcriptional repressor